jgi:hypothetical protein
MNFNSLWRQHPDTYLHRGHLQVTKIAHNKGPLLKWLVCWERFYLSDRLNCCSVFSNQHWVLPRSIVHEQVCGIYVQELKPKLCWRFQCRYLRQSFVEIRPAKVSYRPVKWTDWGSVPAAALWPPRPALYGNLAARTALGTTKPQRPTQQECNDTHCYCMGANKHSIVGSGRETWEFRS